MALWCWCRRQTCPTAWSQDLQRPGFRFEERFLRRFLHIGLWRFKCIGGMCNWMQLVWHCWKFCWSGVVGKRPGLAKTWHRKPRSNWSTTRAFLQLGCSWGFAIWCIPLRFRSRSRSADLGHLREMLSEAASAISSPCQPCQFFGMGNWRKIGRPGAECLEEARNTFWNMSRFCPPGWIAGLDRLLQLQAARTCHPAKTLQRSSVVLTCCRFALAYPHMFGMPLMSFPIFVLVAKTQQL